MCSYLKLSLSAAQSCLLCHHVRHMLVAAGVRTVTPAAGRPYWNEIAEISAQPIPESLLFPMGVTTYITLIHSQAKRTLIEKFPENIDRFAALGSDLARH